MKRRETGALACVVFVAFISFSTGARSSTVVADGTDIGILNPSASGDGRIVAVERVRFEQPPLALCGEVAFTDVAIYEPQAACGGRVFRQLTHDGRSSDPSVSADGAWVAWRTLDPDGTTLRFRIARPDGADESEVFTCSGGQAWDLEISPTGDWIVFRAFDCSGSGRAEILRVDTSTSAMDVVDWMPAAGDLGLNRDRCISNAGTVLYSKRIPPGMQHDLFKRDVGGGVMLAVAATPTDERNISIDGVAGHTCVFRRTSLTGTDDLFAVSSTGAVKQLTASANPAWDILDATVSRNGRWFVFTSSGNHAAQNADGSHEVFVGGPISWAPGGTPFRQVTHVTQAPPPAPATMHAVFGATVNETSLEVLASSRAVPLASPCLAGDMNALPLTSYPLASVSAFAEPLVDRFPVPSFEAYLDPIEAAGTGCVVDPAHERHVTCVIDIRNSAEGTRRFQVHATWDNQTCPVLFTPGAVEVDVGASEVAHVTLEYDAECLGAVTGTATFDVVSPDAGQPDVRTVRAVLQ